MTHQVRVTLNADGTGTLLVGDEDISNAVQRVVVLAGVRDTPTVQVELVAPLIEVDGAAEVLLTDQTVRALQVLGWTPPATDHPDCKHWIRGAAGEVITTPDASCRGCQRWAANPHP